MGKVFREDGQTGFSGLDGQISNGFDACRTYFSAKLLGGSCDSECSYKLSPVLYHNRQFKCRDRLNNSGRRVAQSLRPLDNLIWNAKVLYDFDERIESIPARDVKYAVETST